MYLSTPLLDLGAIKIALHTYIYDGFALQSITFGKKYSISSTLLEKPLDLDPLLALLNRGPADYYYRYLYTNVTDMLFQLLLNILFAASC